MIHKFRHLSLWHFLWMSIVASELLTGFVVSVMSIIFRGRVTFDYLVTGAVASLIVSALVVSIILCFMKQLRNAEHELRGSNKKLKSIIRTSPNIIYCLDRNCKISFISDAIGDYGYTPEELLGGDIMDLVHPEDREMAKCRINERRTGNSANSSKRRGKR